MFVAFLDPFGPRDVPAPKLWVFHKMLHATGQSGIHYLVSDAYLEDAQVLFQSGRGDADPKHAQKLGYELPQPGLLRSLPHTVLATPWWQRLCEDFPSAQAAWAWLLIHEHPPQREEFLGILRDLQDKEQIEAVISWQNCPSLSAAAALLDIPVIHNELGPLRQPIYKNTVYFDFHGVNGATEASDRYAQFSVPDDALMSIEQLQSRFFNETFLSQYSRTLTGMVEYDAGIALQLEDDSNTLSYSNGWTSQALLAHTRTCSRSRVLVRDHPIALFHCGEELVDLDQSPFSLHFLKRVDKLYTINSSVGVEALLLGKETHILGDNPARFIAELPHEQKLRALNFFLVNYLIPHDWLFDLDYYRWRLGGPTEDEIWTKHLANLRSVAPSLLPCDETGPADLLAALEVGGSRVFAPVVVGSDGRFTVRYSVHESGTAAWLPSIHTPCVCSVSSVNGTWADALVLGDGHALCPNGRSRFVFDAEPGDVCIEGQMPYVAGSRTSTPYDLMQSLATDCATSHVEVRRLTELVAGYKEHVRGFESSLSWRITKPLRAMQKIVKGR